MSFYILVEDLRPYPVTPKKTIQNLTPNIPTILGLNSKKCQQNASNLPDHYTNPTLIWSNMLRVLGLVIIIRIVTYISVIITRKNMPNV